MGYRSGIRFFKPIIYNLIKSSWQTRQYGLVFVIILFFFWFGILELISLIFTGKTFSTSFKYYARKEPEKAKEVVDSMSYAFNNIEEHFIKRIKT